MIKFKLLIIIFITSLSLFGEDQIDNSIPTNQDNDIDVGITMDEKLKAEEKVELSYGLGRSATLIRLTENEYPPLEKNIDRVTFKLMRGVVNMATGCAEIPRQLIISALHDNFLLILPIGLSRGIAMTVVRTIVGVTDTVLFFYSIDGTYGANLNPSYVWQVDEITPRTQYPPIN